MPRPPVKSQPRNGPINVTLRLGLTALGAFIAGRWTQMTWSPSDYTTLDDLLGALPPTSSGNGTAVLDSSSPSSAHHQQPLLQDSPYYINDETMRLSPYVDHLWLHNERDDKNKPKTKIILTEFGWNQPNQTLGLTYPRSMRSRELMQAVIDHPLFDPTFSWTDMRQGKLQIDPTLQYFVFLDVETCFEANYPNYVGDFTLNADRANRRTVLKTSECQCMDIIGCDAPVILKALRSPLFQQVPTARLFYFDCRGFGPALLYRNKYQFSPQLSIVSLSSDAATGQLLNTSDMGQPPPAIHPARLSHSTRHQIRTTCQQEQQRSFLLSCVGNVRNDVRQNLFRLHNEEQGVILMVPDDFQARFNHRNTTYEQVLQQSIFAAAPRGDNLFSYRFTEVLSAGAIPVVHADGWVWPFRRELVDWPQECAVLIPEADVANTVSILQQMPEAERCRRRRRCYELYSRYMANPEGTVAGVLESATLALAATAGN